MDHIYKNPKTVYEKFVNAYCRYERRFYAREDLVKTALVKWNEMKSDKAAVEQYISAAPKVAKHKQIKLSFPAAAPRNVPPPPPPPTPPPPQPTPSTSSFASGNAPVHNIIDVTKDTAVDIKRHEVKNFLSNFAPSLLTDDVLNNDSFVSGVSNFVADISKFKLLESEYKVDAQRSTKTKLRSDLLDVSQMVSSLFEKMDGAGEIKLSFSQGTAQLSLQAAKKNGKLTEILAAAASVTHKMKETKILYRVQKRKLQIKQNAKTEFMDSELIIRCRNSSLSWTEAYNRFIAKAIDVPKKISVASIQYAAERVENETFVSSEDIAVDLDLESKNDMIEALLSNFPIMQISRGKTSVLIDFKGLLLHEDAFLKLLSVEKPDS